MILSHAGDIRQKNADDNNIKIKKKKKNLKRKEIYCKSPHKTLLSG
jgi:hypothetical protein